MNKYQVYVDTVDKEEDWEFDEKINVIELIIEAEDSEMAEELAIDFMVKNHPKLYFYVWEVTKDDILVA